MWKFFEVEGPKGWKEPISFIVSHYHPIVFHVDLGRKKAGGIYGIMAWEFPAGVVQAIVSTRWGHQDEKCFKIIQAIQKEILGRTT